MFEQYAVVFWVALFAALLFYLVWRSVAAPYLVRRFYERLSLAKQSPVASNAHAESQLLQRLAAGPVYAGNYGGKRVEQFAASMTAASASRFNHTQRRKEHHAWTVTLLHCEERLPLFCARPVRARDAMEYLLNTDNVIFPDDELFSNKIHVLADNHPELISCFTAPVRQYLDGIDPVSLESTGRLLVLKTPRQPHDTGSKLQQDLDALIELYNNMSASLSLAT
jgi:hypothetical protein